jgi:hypothetical protein
VVNAEIHYALWLGRLISLSTHPWCRSGCWAWYLELESAQLEVGLSIWSGGSSDLMLERRAVVVLDNRAIVAVERIRE